MLAERALERALENALKSALNNNNSNRDAAMLLDKRGQFSRNRICCHRAAK